jgi:hypothetical protein
MIGIGDYDARHDLANMTRQDRHVVAPQTVSWHCRYDTPLSRQSSSVECAMQ